MPRFRGTSPLRVSNFLGENDDVPMEVAETQASTLENLYKSRQKLVRRKGTSALGSSNLSPDQNLQMLEWFTVGTTEHLLGVHNTNLVDFFDATVGATVPNGSARFVAGADVNAAWVERVVYLGDGTSQNTRYSGGSGTSDLATHFTAASSQALTHATNANLQTGDIDFTVAAWVYFDSLGADRPIITRWDNSTSSLREYRLWYNNAASKLEFSVWNFTGPFFADALSAIAVATGTWYYVVGWHDSVANTVNIQVNNGAVVSTAYSNGITANTVDFNIGRLETGTTFMDGRIERAGFWKSAASGGGVLTAGLRTSLYNSGAGKNYSMLSAAEKVALIDYWNLGATYTDSVTASANDLTAVNTPTTAQGVDFVKAAATAMVDKAPNTFTLADAGAGSMGHGEFSYKVSFVNVDGVYGEPSDAKTVSTLFQPNTRDVFVGSLPNSALDDVTAITIWRLNPESTVYQKVTTLPIGTASFNDTIGDISGNEIMVDFNTRFPPAKYLIEHQNRLIGAGNAADPQTVYISNVSQPYYSPASPDLDDPNQGTRAKLQGRAAGEITGLCSHGAVVAVFTGGAGHLLQGVDPNSFLLTKFCDHGCVSHRTIVSVKSLLLWLGPDGVYQWDGRQTQRISDDQRGTIEAMTAAEMAGSHAFVWEERYYLCWSTGSIVFDLQYGVWTTNTNWLWHDSTVTTYVSGNKQRIYAALEGHARVYQLEVGATDASPAAATAIAARWVSRDWDCGLAGREKRAHYIEIKAKKGTGTATVTLKKGTGATVQTVTHNLALVDDPNETVARLFESTVEQARSEHFRLDWSCSTTATELELLAAGLHWSVAQ